MKKIFLGFILVSVTIYGIQFFMLMDSNIVLSLFLGSLTVLLGDILLPKGRINHKLATLILLLFDIVIISFVVLGLLYFFQYLFLEEQNIQNITQIALTIGIFGGLSNYKKTEGYEHK